MIYDICIIGLGPAGSTLARKLSGNLNVVAIDAKNPNGIDGFKKPCGGLLSPDAQEALARDNIALPTNILSNPQIFCVDTIDFNSKQRRVYQRSYINMDRHKFDLWLISLIPSYIKIHLNSKCTRIQKSDEVYKVTFKEGSVEKTILAKNIVGADGANSYVRRKFFKTKIRQYLCIQDTYKMGKNNIDESYVCFFDNNFSDCYGWIDYKDGCCQIGMALPKHNAFKNFTIVKDRLKNLNYPLINKIDTEACLVNSPQSTKEICLGEGRIFLIGEAAGFVSPSSLEGISYALNTGKILANIFNKNMTSPMNEYKKACRKLYIKIALKILKAPFLFNPAIRKIVMKSGVTSISKKPFIDNEN